MTSGQLRIRGISGSEQALLSLDTARGFFRREASFDGPRPPQPFPLSLCDGQPSPVRSGEGCSEDSRRASEAESNSTLKRAAAGLTGDLAEVIHEAASCTCQTGRIRRSRMVQDIFCIESDLDRFGLA